MNKFLLAFVLLFSTSYAFSLPEEVENLQKSSPYDDLKHEILNFHEWMMIEAPFNSFALYTPITKTISFRDDTRSSVFNHDRYHEEGHHVFEYKIGQKKKREWINEFYNAPMKYCVSEYGLTANGNWLHAPAECFAEVYALVRYGSHSDWKHTFPQYWYNEPVEDSWQHRFVRHFLQNEKTNNNTAN